MAIGGLDDVMDIIYINGWTILCPLYIFSKNKMNKGVIFLLILKRQG